MAKAIKKAPVMKATPKGEMKNTVTVHKEDVVQFDGFIKQVQDNPRITKSSVVKNWTIFLMITAIIYAIFYFVPFENIWHSLPTMSAGQVLFFALALAFTWVEKLKLGTIKPFSCVPCMTGWFAVILAFLFHAQFWPLYVFAGLFVGSLYSAIKMRL